MGPVLLLLPLVWTSEGGGVEIGVVGVAAGVLGLGDCGGVESVIVDIVADGMSDLVMITALTLTEAAAATVGVAR